MSQTPRLFNLGEIIASDSVVSDSLMSKQALSHVLGVSRPTIWRYDNVAYWEIPDYKDEYPLLPKDQWLIKKSKHDREVPLTQYQIWVISAIQICFKFYKKEVPVKQFIKENPYVFTRARYEMRLRQLAGTSKAS
ncbi:MAG: hypothetical protein KME57_36275 [Scytonema hyalinum WJT4-NPBG1]|jgi:hypothetical protein|nr:hypothetical protein [Scytonema hyalinum WJT4-NPBG1]